jgi:PAS domain S-box-containing protein
MNTLPGLSSQESLETFRLAVEHASDHIIITDVHGIILFANPAVVHTTGYSPDEIIGKTPAVWGHQMSEEFNRSMWDTILVKKQIFSGRLTNRRKNGQLYDAESHISPILDDSGSVKYFVGVERDITKEIEIDRMKSDFISIASHQLRTPLTSLRWLMEMLGDTRNGPLNRAQQTLINKMKGSMKLILDIVTGLLDMTRLESGKMSISPETVQLGQFIQSIVDEIKQKYEEKKQTIHVEILDSIDSVIFDPKLIRNVYINLLTNAIKYSPEKKTIGIKVYKKEENFVSEITDEGYGIPKDQQDKIFQRFFRARNITNLETEGTGLGLYLVKMIITSCKGNIWFESHEGTGTTFSFSLPLLNALPVHGDVTLEPFS